MADRTLPPSNTLGNGQSDAAIHLLDDEPIDDGMCGSVSLIIVALFLLYWCPLTLVN
jgi:hypothetical protein